MQYRFTFTARNRASAKARQAALARLIGDAGYETCGWSESDVRSNAWTYTNRRYHGFDTNTAIAIVSRFPDVTVR